MIVGIFSKISHYQSRVLLEQWFSTGDAFKLSKDIWKFLETFLVIITLDGNFPLPRGQRCSSTYNAWEALHKNELSSPKINSANRERSSGLRILLSLTLRPRPKIYSIYLRNSKYKP